MSTDISSIGAGRDPAAATARIDSVVTHHRDGFRSGVARFNELLAQHLGVSLHPLSGCDFGSLQRPLLSFKFSELGADEAVLAALPAEVWQRSDLFLHELSESPLETRAIRLARWVHCGNLAIQESVREQTDHCAAVWTPGLLVDGRPFVPTEISVFSFGMAHKIRTPMFRRLRELLEQSERSYALYVSTANHETASIQDAQVVFEEMTGIFPERLYFLGNLSDVAVHNYLQTSTYFAAFFDEGVRANNTSIASAMERGAVVITNLDRFSPPEYRHMENLIDLQSCDALPSDPMTLRRLGLRAMETARERGWEHLVAALNT